MTITPPNDPNPSYMSDRLQSFIQKVDAFTNAIKHIDDTKSTADYMGHSVDLKSLLHDVKSTNKDMRNFITRYKNTDTLSKDTLTHLEKEIKKLRSCIRNEIKPVLKSKLNEPLESDDINEPLETSEIVVSFAAISDATTKPVPLKVQIPNLKSAEVSSTPKPQRSAEAKEAQERYKKLPPEVKLSSHNIEDSSTTENIKTLLKSIDTVIWKKFDADTYEIVTRPFNREECSPLQLINFLKGIEEEFQSQSAEVSKNQKPKRSAEAKEAYVRYKKLPPEVRLASQDIEDLKTKEDLKTLLKSIDTVIWKKLGADTYEIVTRPLNHEKCTPLQLISFLKGIEEEFQPQETPEVSKNAKEKKETIVADAYERCADRNQAIDQLVTDPSLKFVFWQKKDQYFLLRRIGNGIAERPERITYDDLVRSLSKQYQANS